MKIVRFEAEDGSILLGERVDERRARVLEEELNGESQSTDRMVSIRRLLPPVQPVNVFCIGLNYREHAVESGMEFPKQPILFMKPTSTVIGPGDPIPIPACCDPEGEVDYECELAVVIGKAARNVTEEDALDYVLGYTAANDVSARKWQLNGGGGQWIRGKSFDGFCPLGPVLVTKDEIPDPQSLSIKTIVNGEVLQNLTTGDMIFDVRALISFLSRDMTLLPGTVILTGTPQGVGFARRPPVWLQAGDEVVIEIEGIGRLVNPVISAHA